LTNNALPKTPDFLLKDIANTRENFPAGFQLNNYGLFLFTDATTFPVLQGVQEYIVKEQNIKNLTYLCFLILFSFWYFL
jgi:hypothetical protein